MVGGGEFQTAQWIDYVMRGTVALICHCLLGLMSKLDRFNKSFIQSIANRHKQLNLFGDGLFEKINI